MNPTKILFVGASFALLTGFASAEMTIRPPAEADAMSPAQAWCDGYTTALRSMQINRAHWRKILDLPDKTADQIRDEIYSRDPPNVSGSITNMVAESADLYLIPPIYNCTARGGGK